MHRQSERHCRVRLFVQRGGRKKAFRQGVSGAADQDYFRGGDDVYVFRQFALTSFIFIHRLKIPIRGGRKYAKYELFSQTAKIGLELQKSAVNLCKLHSYNLSNFSILAVYNFKLICYTISS